MQGGGRRFDSDQLHQPLGTLGHGSLLDSSAGWFGPAGVGCDLERVAPASALLYTDLPVLRGPVHGSGVRGGGALGSKLPRRQGREP